MSGRFQNVFSYDQMMPTEDDFLLELTKLKKSKSLGPAEVSCLVVNNGEQCTSLGQAHTKGAGFDYLILF